MPVEIYETPELTDDDLEVLGLITGLLERVKPYVRTPRRWHGTLRNELRASSVQGSNAIEGYVASVGDVAAILAGENPSAEVDDATHKAIEGYRQAMGFVLRATASEVAAADAPVPSSAVPLLDLSTLLSLHYMLIGHEIEKRPGRWRKGWVGIVDATGNVIYEAPPVEMVEPLLIALCDEVVASSTSRLVNAAMAHLNLTMIHPFADGNGRMSRVVQSLILTADKGAFENAAEDDIQLTHDFGNIEEYLARNQAAYYEVLRSVSDGSWSPQMSARPWLEFNLVAYYRQALSILRRVSETEALWDRFEQLTKETGLPDRTVGALCEAARDWHLTRPLYMARSGEPISESQASRDLALMVAAGLLEAEGKTKGRTYKASARLQGIGREVLAPYWQKELPNPYDEVRAG